MIRNKLLLLLGLALASTISAPARADGPGADTQRVSPTRPPWTGDNNLHLLGYTFDNVQPMADHWGALHVKDELPGALDSATRDGTLDLVVFQDLDDKKLFVSYGRDGIFSNMGWATPGRIGSYQGRRVKVLWSRDEPNTFTEGAYRVFPWIGSIFGESGASQVRGAVATAMGAILSSGITAFFIQKAAGSGGGLTLTNPGYLAGIWNSLRVPLVAGAVVVAGTALIGGIAAGAVAEITRRTHGPQRQLIVSQLIASDGAGTQAPPPAPAAPPTLREGIERVLPEARLAPRVTSVTPGAEILDGDDLRITSRDG